MNYKIIENRLIPVMENKDGENLVDGRNLHEFLKIQKDFSDWIKNQLQITDAKQDIDYTSLKGNCTTMRPRSPIEYILTLDTVKEICMVAGVAPNTNFSSK